jgi:hypothetical protein
MRMQTLTVAIVDPGTECARRRAVGSEFVEEHALLFQTATHPSDELVAHPVAAPNDQGSEWPMSSSVGVTATPADCDPCVPFQLVKRRCVFE